jgi:hypothetical protein
VLNRLNKNGLNLSGQPHLNETGQSSSSKSRILLLNICFGIQALNELRNE